MILSANTQAEPLNQWGRAVRSHNLNMEEELEESACAIKRGLTTESEVGGPQEEQEEAKCVWLYVVGYLGTVYFVIMAIIYILIQYALIQKAQFPLFCSLATNICEGTISYINAQSLIFVELASQCPQEQIQLPTGIAAIVLSNSTQNVSLALTNEEYPNAYPSYRQLQAVATLTLIYGYNVTVYFQNAIPEPFLRDLSLILRADGLFGQDQAIQQAATCLVFAACVAFFNIFTKITQKHAKSKPPVLDEKSKIHRIYGQAPKDIEEIDENLENIREIALKWLTKSHKKSLQYSETDSEYSFLSTE